jgi:glycosyltransferase involved in cell wall biosynthesis
LEWWHEHLQQERDRDNVVRRLSGFVAPTEHAVGLSAPHLHPDTKTVVIPHPCHFEPIRKSKTTPSDWLVAAFIGRVIPFKGLDVLLDAFDQIAASVPVVLKIVSPANDDWTSYRESMRERCLGVKRIQWIEKGVLRGDDLANLHATIDVLAVPSVWLEYFGFVTVEALSLGTPVLLPDYPNQRELFESRGVGVSFVTPGNVSEWAKALERAWEQKQAHALRVDGSQFLTVSEYGQRIRSFYEQL